MSDDVRTNVFHIATRHNTVRTIRCRHRQQHARNTELNCSISFSPLIINCNSVSASLYPHKFETFQCSLVIKLYQFTHEQYAQTECRICKVYIFSVFIVFFFVCRGACDQFFLLRTANMTRNEVDAIFWIVNGSTDVKKNKTPDRVLLQTREWCCEFFLRFAFYNYYYHYILMAFLLSIMPIFIPMQIFVCLFVRSRM